MIVDSYIVFNIPTTVQSKGDLIFKASSDHSAATNYQVRVFAAGTLSPILATQNLLVPNPNELGVITVNIQVMLNALPPGNYDVIVAVTTPAGTTQSNVSNPFTVPLV